MFLLRRGNLRLLVVVALCVIALHLEEDLLSKFSRFTQGEWSPISTADLGQVLATRQGHLDNLAEKDINISAAGLPKDEVSSISESSATGDAMLISDASKLNEAQKSPLVIAYCNYKQSERRHVRSLVLE
jgi:hypothetical protein